MIFTDGNNYFTLKRTLHDSDEHTLGDRTQRLKYLADADNLKDICLIPAPDGLTASYREEAAKCYVQGTFIAAIVMVSLTFDVLLRSIFRSKHGENRCDKRHLDNMDFSELIDNALAEGHITLDESKALYHIRKIFANPIHRQKQISFMTLPYLSKHMILLAAIKLMMRG
jgi:hypothetical protein